MEYFKSIKKNDLTYSIDMLRLSCDITYFEYSEIEFMFSHILKKNVKKFYIGNKISDFKYNYIIEVGDGISFWFGFLPNSQASMNENKKYNFTIEFNPNKLQMNNLLTFILYKFSDWYVKSYDCAVDIPINILDIVNIDKGKKQLIKTISTGGDNKTIYLGVGHNRIKIYNKKRESNLDIKGELTRCEVSITCEELEVRRIAFYDFIGYFPELYLANYLYSFSDYTDKTILAILYAVQCGFPVNSLSRTYKTKIKKLYENGNMLKFDKKCVGDILRNVIYSYFVQSKSKVIFL